jgi:hypothetical protein
MSKKVKVAKPVEVMVFRECSVCRQGKKQTSGWERKMGVPRPYSPDPDNPFNDDYVRVILTRSDADWLRQFDCLTNDNVCDFLSYCSDCLTFECMEGSSPRKDCNLRRAVDNSV